MSASPEAHQVPDIKSWDDFKQISEIHDTDDSGKSVLNCTTFVVFNEAGYCFRGSVKAPKDQITLDQARSCLSQDSADSSFPATPMGMPTTDEFPLSKESNTYIKMPNTTAFNAYANPITISNNILREAKILELLTHYPHPNIVDFRGAVIKHGRIVGLALDKYPRGLAQYMSSGAYGAGVSRNQQSLSSLSTTDKQGIIDGIAAGLSHLHSLGLAHNDVNPANVMFTEEGTPVIVDLGSCRPTGETLHERGTVGWNEGFSRTSDVQNDLIGLKAIAKWLDVKSAYADEGGLSASSRQKASADVSGIGFQSVEHGRSERKQPTVSIQDLTKGAFTANRSGEAGIAASSTTGTTQSYQPPPVQPVQGTKSGMWMSYGDDSSQVDGPTAPVGNGPQQVKPSMPLREDAPQQVKPSVESAPQQVRPTIESPPAPMKAAEPAVGTVSNTWMSYR